MAAIDQYKIKISVEGQQAVDRLNDSVDNLGATLAKVAFGAFIANAFRMADAMTDISDATGIALENVIAFGNAMSAAGGDANNADKALVTFYKNLQDMANGSDQAEEKLNKVGITMQDLRNLSEEELLQKAIDNLGSMKEGADRSAIAIDAFGKSFNTIDPNKLKETFDPGKTKEYAAAMRQAGDAVDNLQKNFKLLQQAAVNVFGPVLNELSQFKLDIKVAENLIKTLAVLLAANFGAKAAGYIFDIVKAIQAWNAATKGQITLQTILLALSGPRGWAMIAGAVGAATLATIALNKALDENIQKQQEAAGAQPGTSGAGQGAFPQASEFAEKEKEQRELAAKAAARTTQEIIKQNEIANKLQRTIASTIGMEENRADIIKATAQIEADYANKRLALQNQINAEQAKGKDANDGIVIALRNQITELNKQEVISKQLTLDAIERNRLERERIALIDSNVKKIQEMAEFEKQSADTLYRQIVIQGGMTEKEAQRRLAIKSAEAEKTAKLYALDAALAKETDAVKKKILEDEYKRLEQSENKKIDAIKRRYELEDELQESWKAGAIKALEDIANATKPYKQAQDIIASTWGKIGNAIDTFVETGKFKFKDFARSVIADIAKIIAKAALLNAIKAGLGAFGISIPGFAEGGNVKGNQPIMVGEKGPELFVPPSAGKIIPNNQLNQGSGKASNTVSAPVTNNYNTYNISALDAKSVAQMFAENRKAIFGANKMAEREMSYAGAR
jgi:lambda family phage tail tape measure protein